MPAFLTTFSIETNMLLLVLSGIVIVLALWIIRLEVKLHRFTRGKDGKNLEASILSIKRGHENIEQFRGEMEAYLRNVETRLARSVRDVRTVRFNPFKESGTGGDQSFATALLSEEGDGVILSSLYTRDRVSMFAKPVSQYNSDHELTKEEQAVLEKSRQSLTRRHDQ